MMRVIFVCHGNICRSPMAEYIMKDLVRKAGAEADFEISSAAVSYEEEGNAIYPPAARKLKEKGIPQGNHRAHRITPKEAGDSDIIVIMDSSNERLIKRIINEEDHAKVRFLLERDVADPWYTGDFEQAYRDILSGCEALMQSCMQASGRRAFLKKAGAMAIAATALPSALAGCAGGKSSRTADKVLGSKEINLEWEDFTGILKHTFTISGSSRSSTPIVLTRVTWDGVTGYGEASMPPYLGESQESVHAFLSMVREKVLPRFNDPFRLEEILAETDALAPGNTAAKASVDIALHDLVGKIMGQPWWKIWGFCPDTTPCTSFTIGYDASDSIVRQKTDEASWAKVLKVKLGMGAEEDKRMIRLIRERNPQTPIYIDANQGWRDRHWALDMIHWLKNQGVVMVEQPMSKLDFESHAWLTERSPLPIIADEACQRLADIPSLKGVYSGINIKLMKCTGMREAREMVTLASSLGMRLMIGCMTETSVAISAAAQLSPKMEWADLDGNILLSNDCFTGMQLQDGRITLPSTPGIGVTPIDS